MLARIRIRSAVLKHLLKAMLVKCIKSSLLLRLLSTIRTFLLTLRQQGAKTKLLKLRKVISSFKALREKI